MLFVALAYAADLRAALADRSGWEEVGRKTVSGAGEVVVRHKVASGQDCLEGEATAVVSADVLLAAATDVLSQPSWSSAAVVASVKLSSGSTSFDYYQVLDNPAPVSDRYWILHATSGVSGTDRVFTWDQVDGATKYPQAVTDILAKWPSAVPTRVNVGAWTFTPGTSGTRIRYQICTDAGGNLPTWVGQIAAKTTLPTNLADIVNEAKRRGG